ncbi:MAG: hypothetical protein JWR19_1019 [Pedosphaera sp.]|nr:hypothetical protein [Pedosphaera sp.]
MNTKTDALPFKIRIASPCSARWEDMGGDDRIRFCDHCRKNVYNFTSLTAPEVAALVEAKGGNLCARMHQRADGTMLTEDCPVGVARQWRRVKILVGGGAALILLTLGNLAAFGRDRGDASAGTRPGNRLMARIEDATYTVKGWLGLNPPPIMLGQTLQLPPTMGIIAAPTPVTPVTPPPAPAIKMGEVSMAPSSNSIPSATAPAKN